MLSETEIFPTEISVTLVTKKFNWALKLMSSLYCTSSRQLPRQLAIQQPQNVFVQWQLVVMHSNQLPCQSVTVQFQYDLPNRQGEVINYRAVEIDNCIAKYINFVHACNETCVEYFSAIL